MDPEVALELAKRGGTLLFLDVPQYTLIGIDTQMFSSGPNFKGIKMIPPGVHFVFYSSANREGNAFSPIIGFFIVLKPSEVVVRKWDKKEERFVKFSEEDFVEMKTLVLVQKKSPYFYLCVHLDPSNGNGVVIIQGLLVWHPHKFLEQRYAEAVRKFEFDTQLGPYMLNQYVDWSHLSNYITESVIEHIEPIGGEITVSSEPESISNIPKTPMEKALAGQLKSSKYAISVEKSERKGCYFTPIPRLIKHKGLSGHELTNMNLDKTQVLETILAKEYDRNEDSLLGELQFSFIAFLMGQSLEAYLQWKLITSLLLGCIEAPLNTRSRLFTKFVQVIYYQLKFGLQKEDKKTDVAEKGAIALMDESWLSDDSFLHILCKEFFSLLLEAPVIDGDLLSWTRRLKDLLEDSVGWDFEPNSAADEFNHGNDEYAPVVEVIEDDVGQNETEVASMGTS
ncbi:unnamed protein product [Cuscuta campestris]|uniref:Protein AAR2 homolog n=1 Tax=Cuscuta campestris TaxID=132261 RepID=A0A484NFF9_9ASTE|nr:unnamed protein product [Cuscuta campestris]